MNCETCKHWRRDTHPPDFYTEAGSRLWGEEQEAAATNEPVLIWGWCSRVAEFGPRQGASDKFYVIDGSSYSASLSTRADFGCVEHEMDI